MEYKEIVVVSGEPGLFQLVSSKSDGAIVRTLDGSATRFVPSRNHQFTPLESIEVFTTGENVPLMDIFRAMEAQEAATPLAEARDAAEIKAYFGKVYPELDLSRVYMSDMKKMLKWYPLLKERDLIGAAGAQDDEAAGVAEPAEAAAPEAVEKPAPAAEEKKKKTAPATKRAPKAKAAAKDTEAPAKKSTPKKPKTEKKES